jgi:hypothetical protein
MAAPTIRVLPPAAATCRATPRDRKAAARTKITRLFVSADRATASGIRERASFTQRSDNGIFGRVEQHDARHARRFDIAERFYAAATVTHTGPGDRPHFSSGAQMPSQPDEDNEHHERNTNQARQAVTLGRMRYVLFVGLGLVVGAYALIYLIGP